MTLEELLQALKEHSDKKEFYQIHLNSGDLEESSKRSSDIEFVDFYFNSFSMLNETTLSFGNRNSEPIINHEKEMTTYPLEFNNNIYIDLTKVERIEILDDLEEFEDLNWFDYPSSKIIHIYMIPQDITGTSNRNILTIGFMK